MTVIGIDPIGTTSLYCMTTSTNSIVQDENEATSTALGLATTLSSSFSQSEHISINTTTRYISSLSDEQLAMFSEMIDNSEKSFVENDQKVYKKNLV